MTESTFSLAQIWAQGDGVSHAVAIMLALMSLASWSVIFVKAWSLVQLRRMSGLEDGVIDALYRFSRPLTGGYYWCPPMTEGAVDLQRLLG